MKDLARIYESDRRAWYAARDRDAKIGEKVQLAPPGSAVKDWLSTCSAAFVLLGAAEDVGIRANSGRPGAADNWAPFLKAFMNMQSNAFFCGEHVAILGVYRPTASQDTLFDQVSQLDKALHELIRQIGAARKIPVLIGGGHNNAYPLLSGMHKAEQQPISVLNMDAHPDFRAPEGRHSGNPFRYAQEAGCLRKYALLGYHKAYMPAYVWQDLQAEALCWARSYEEIMLNAEYSFDRALEEGLQFLQGELCGLELDVDALEGADASARSPSGFSMKEGRKYVQAATKALAPCYFHLSEARNVEEPATMVGKRLAYLVYDFLSTHPKGAMT